MVAMPRNIGHLLIHRIDITRSTRAKTGKGGFTKTQVSQGIVRGRIWPVTQKDLMVGAQEQARVTHAVIFQPSTDVRVADELVFDSRKFVVRVPNITPSIPIYRKVLAEEIQIN